jgi:hypothetical protein
MMIHGEMIGLDLEEEDIIIGIDSFISINIIYFIYF